MKTNLIAFKNLLKLSKYLKLYKADLVLLGIALTGVSLTLLSLGQAFKGLIDYGLKENHPSAINNSILSIILLIIIFGVSSFFRAYIINNVAEKIINKIRLDAFTNLINRKIAYFDDEKVSIITSKLTIDLELISKLIVNFLSFFLRNFLILIGAIIWMFFQSQKLSLIVIFTIPIILIPILKLGRYVRTLSRDASDSQEGIVADLDESFSYVRTLHAFNQQAYRIFQFKELVAKYLMQTSVRFKIRSLFFAITISIILASITLVIWIGSMDIVKGNMTSGQMISFIYYAIVAGVSAGGIAELISEIQSPLIALEKVLDLIDTEQSIIPSSETFASESKILTLNDARNVEIEFHNVEFSYPTRTHLKVINNMTFKITPNSFIGIIGPSGSGKSTIIQLLLKFYTGFLGSITLNGYNILKISSQDLRRIFAYVPQEPSIFSGNIRSNIAFSNPHANDAEIMKVAEITGITEFLSKLPAGLDTEIGSKGVKLSGGQKQRIAIARALLFNPKILLLDEATSSLDRASEAIILNKIREFMAGKTIISISHRVSSLENTDEILVIENGTVVTRKKYENLLDKTNLSVSYLE